MTRVGGVPAKKSLGQNFLVDDGVAGRIIDAADVGPTDTVVEIGPGHGVLTRGLAGRAGRVIAIELDPMLYDKLKSEFSGVPNLELVLGDALKYPYEGLDKGVKVVANLPYYISTPIITRLIAARGKINLMVLMLQKEVAARITAPPGGKDYGYLSVMVQLYTEPKVLFDVSRHAFKPEPKVDSAILKLQMRTEPAVAVADYALFEKIVSAAFSQRRKTLRNTMKASGLFTDEGTAGLAGSGIDPTRRAETFTVAEFGLLTDFLFEFRKSK